jgi:agmatinase
MRLPLATSLAGLDAAIIGLPSDSGSPFRTGSRFAPNAIRAISAMLRPINPYRGSINIFEKLMVADVGDAAVVPGYEEESLRALEESVRTLIDAEVMPFAIGGDHSVTLASLRAIASRFGPVALIQFDSHTDTWDSYFSGKRYSAGTPFRRAVEEELVTPKQSIQIGMRGSLFQITDISQSLALGYQVLTCDEFFEMGVQAVADCIAVRAAGRPCFITFDMDFVDPGSAPGVQTPESGGPTAREALLLLRRLHDLRLIGCDVVEMNPLYDDPGQTTALLAATVMAELLALAASSRQ